MKYTAWVSMAALTLAITGCGTLGVTGGSSMGEQGVASEQAVRFGTITHINPVELESDAQLGLGAVLGAAAGGLLGHQIGSGSGQDVATVLGVIGGGLAGSKVQQKYADKRAGQVVTVRLENGVSVAITQPTDSSLAVGQRVRVEGAGQSARVYRR